MSEVAKVIVGELFGTFILVLLGNCVVANTVLKNSKGENSGWIVICVGWGFAVAVAALLSQISGAHLNPAVTIGLWIAGTKTAFVGGNFVLVPLYIVCQLGGAMLGQAVVYLTYFKEYQNTDEPAKILATFSTSPAHRSYIWNTMTEIIGTFVLLMIVIASVGPIKNLVTSGGGFAGAATVGLGVMVIGLAIGGPTGFAINPARDLGPRIMHLLLPITNKGKSDWSYSWVPVVGPMIGAILAAGFVRLIGLF